jgi:putative Mg2+ transporter-C (MgtC) family protein
MSRRRTRPQAEVAWSDAILAPMSTDLAFQFDLVVRLLLAAVLGAAIGLEREFHDHPAGMRTHLLVSVGSATFTVLSIFAFVAPGADPGRIAAQIVSGIGFLGAGAILKYGATVRGLTTAASLWAVAGVGMAAGAGAWGVGLAATVIVLVSLWPLQVVEDRLVGSDQGRMHVSLEVTDTKSLGRLFEALANRQTDVKHLASERGEDGGHRVELEIRGLNAQDTARILDDLDGLDGVTVSGTGPLGD